jgi:hypothetical protein
LLGRYIISIHSSNFINNSEDYVAAVSKYRPIHIPPLDHWPTASQKFIVAL